ncbi:hypothetical protein AAG906_021205 [Vitis piasezkii]
MFKDIGKRPSVAEMIRNACKKTNFIYNHGWLLVEMRKYCGGEIVRLGATRLNLHSFIIAYFLNPRFQYKRGLVLFRDAKRGFGDQARVASRSTIVPKDESFNKDTKDSFQGYFARYDGSKGGTNDGSDNARGDIGERQQSQYPMSQFTSENDFKHCTQDEDHGFRRANVYSPYVMGYGQPSSSSDEEYGMLSYLSAAQMSYQVPYQM